MTSSESSRDGPGSEDAQSPSDPSLTKAADANDIEQQEEEEDEDLAMYQSMSCEELRLESAKLKAERNYDQAALVLSIALELKRDSLEGDETHPDLGPYYLEYGDILLTLAENSSLIFKSETEAEVIPLPHSALPSDRPLVGKPSAGDDASETAISASQQPQETSLQADNNVTDEQLAWEILECARICYAKLLNQLYDDKSLPLSASSDPSLITVVSEASYVHTRLGDLLLGEQQFAEAEVEYHQAVQKLQDAHAPRETTVAPLVALGQTQHYALKFEAATQTFQEALGLIRGRLEELGRQRYPSDEYKKLTLLAADLETQLEEIKVASTQKKTTPPSSETSQPTAESFPKPHTLVQITDATAAQAENPFDKASVDVSNVVNLGRIRSRARNESSEAGPAKVPKLE